MARVWMMAVSKEQIGVGSRMIYLQTTDGVEFGMFSCTSTEQRTTFWWQIGKVSPRRVLELILEYKSSVPFQSPDIPLTPNISYNFRGYQNVLRYKRLEMTQTCMAESVGERLSKSSHGDIWEQSTSQSKMNEIRCLCCSFQQSLLISLLDQTHIL